MTFGLGLISIHLHLSLQSRNFSAQPRNFRFQSRDLGRAIAPVSAHRLRMTYLAFPLARPPVSATAADTERRKFAVCH
jgi:hypothetical protein